MNLFTDKYILIFSSFRADARDRVTRVFTLFRSISILLPGLTMRFFLINENRTVPLQSRRNWLSRIWLRPDTF